MIGIGLYVSSKITLEPTSIRPYLYSILKKLFEFTKQIQVDDPNKAMTHLKQITSDLV